MIVNPEETQNYLDGQFQLQQNGADLLLESLDRVQGTARIGVRENDFSRLHYEPCQPVDGWFRLEAGSMYRVTFSCQVSIPSTMAAIIVHRSSLARSGCFIFSGLYDSGFQGQAGAFLHADNSILLERGARLAQIIFLGSESRELYSGQYQGV